MAAARRKPKPNLTHIDRAGRPRMVDVSAKRATAREAVAKGSVYMTEETLDLAVSGRAAKGDVLTTAQLAGVMAAKRTHELIPLCHPLPLTAVEVSLEPDEARRAIDITATVRTTAKTGVEMEALTAVSVAALTVYDMLKAVQRDIRIGDVRLVRKSGGRSGDIKLEADLPIAQDELMLQTGDRITDCRKKVLRFCEEDFSYRSYDPVAVPQDDVLREDEVRLANRIVARMGDAVVRQFMSRAACVGTALRGIPAESTLWEDWNRDREAVLRELFECVVGPGIGLARATKVLHKKRRNLIPILDGVVAGYAERAAGLTGEPLPRGEAARGVALIRIVREDVTRNLQLLKDLGEQSGLTPLRVFDILAWAWSGEYEPVWAR